MGLPSRLCWAFPVPESDLTDVCLCLSAIPTFIQTNVVAILAVTIAGEQVVTDALTRLVR